MSVEEPQLGGKWRVDVPAPRPYTPVRYRHDPPELVGRAVGFNRDGIPSGSLDYEISGDCLRFMNIDFGVEGAANETGHDNTGQGLGTAILDALEAQYPGHWFQEMGGDHTPEGVLFMESRARPGRRRIHAFDCGAAIKANECTCSFLVHGDNKERLEELRTRREVT